MDNKRRLKKEGPPAKPEGVPLILERLEGTPPQGHHRRLDRGHAEREPEQDGDTDSATASPIGGQGKGELQRLAEYLQGQAAKVERAAEFWGDAGDRGSFESCSAEAAALRSWACLVLAVSPSEPRPQSVADGDEPEAALAESIWLLSESAADWDGAAKVCDTRKDINEDAAIFRQQAARARRACEFLRTLLPQESRKERSVPPIVQAQAPSEPNQ